MSSAPYFFPPPILPFPTRCRKGGRWKREVESNAGLGVAGAQGGDVDSGRVADGEGAEGRRVVGALCVTQKCKGRPRRKAVGGGRAQGGEKRAAGGLREEGARRARQREGCEKRLWEGSGVRDRSNERTGRSPSIRQAEPARKAQTHEGPQQD